MIALLTNSFRRCEARYHRPLAKAEISFFGDYFSFKCYGMPSPACGWSQSGTGSESDRLVSALEVERGGTRVGRRSGELGCGCPGDQRPCPRARLAPA